MVYRFVFGGFKIKVFHYNEQQPNGYQPNQNTQEEGKITIDPKAAQKKRESQNKMGEYVDFEEVK
jgi:hypothetical protein